MLTALKQIEELLAIPPKEQRTTYFLNSIRRQAEAYGSLSKKQLEVLERIYSEQFDNAPETAGQRTGKAKKKDETYLNLRWNLAEECLGTISPEEVHFSGSCVDSLDVQLEGKFRPRKLRDILASKGSLFVDISGVKLLVEEYLLLKDLAESFPRAQNSRITSLGGAFVLSYLAIQALSLLARSVGYGIGYA